MTVLEQLANELSVPADTLRASLLASESAEAAVPNYLTVDPSTGQVGALFPGGLQMLENTSGNYTAGSALGWKDPTTGAVRSFLEGFVIAGNHLLHLAAQPDSNDWAYVNCEAHATGGAGSANVNVSTADNAGNTSSVKLLDSLGRSGFLQLPGTQKLELASGVSGTTAGVGGWNTVNIATNTGFTSYLYLYSVVPTVSLTVVSHAINSANTTAAQLSIDVNLNAPTNVHFYWAAIGS